MLSYTLQAELFVFDLLIFALALDYSARNQQKNCTFLQGNGGSVAGGVRKKAERQARGG